MKSVEFYFLFLRKLFLFVIASVGFRVNFHAAVVFFRRFSE